MIRGSIPQHDDGARRMPVSVNRTHLEQALTFESQRRVRAKAMPVAGDRWFQWLEGSESSGRVLITAPHAMAARRNDDLHGEDPGTGWLAYMLHNLTEVDVLFTTWTSPSDPNYYDENEFKQHLKSAVIERKPRAVLDLHTAKSSRPFELDIGTMHGESLLGDQQLVPTIRRSLARHGMTTFSDNFFPAAKNQTITKWVSRLGVPCIQLEFNAAWLSIGSSPLGNLRSARVLQGLIDVITSIEDRIR